ncbi:MAG: hypothetical protein ABI333_07230 [bacterium]
MESPRVGVACGAILVPVAGQLVTVVASFLGIGAILAPVGTSSLPRDSVEAT